jgi:hypothetical protein
MLCFTGYYKAVGDVDAAIVYTKQSQFLTGGSGAGGTFISSGFTAWDPP